jgi:transglutaminase-like putative cysteine protease
MLFLFFPRIAPLWSVPVPSSSKTGISDTVRPGDIAKLSQSDELAFRVVFDGTMPELPDLYWRGLVYDDYLHGTWSQGPPRLRRSPDRLVPEAERGPGISYRVLQAPTYATFLFGLATPVPSDNAIELRHTYTLQADKPLMSLMRYDVTSFPDFRRDAHLEDKPQRALVLPSGDNPRVRRWARANRDRLGSDAAYVEFVLAEIAQRFTYTLEPPTLPEDNAIDRFWFDTQAGFCSHFAGAFVYLMRAVAIPARMVGGYQGGEVNPLSGHLIVRQYDAHAWAEVWQQGRGWLRVDPTAAVAPERIRSGLNAALSEADRLSLSALTNARLGGFGGLNQLLYMFDSMQHRWNMWVVGYDANLQLDYLTKLLGQRPSPFAIGIAIGVGGALSLLLAGIVLFLHKPMGPTNAIARAFLRFSKAMSRQGVFREPWESPMAFVTRSATHVQLPLGEVTAVVEGLEQLLYGCSAGAEPSRAEQRGLARKLRHLRLRTLLG